MVEEETRRYRPTKNYLEHLPALNLHAFEVSFSFNLFLSFFFTLCLEFTLTVKFLTC